MGNYADLTSAFTQQLNRRDITPAQIALFINDAIVRLQSRLDIPANERTVLFDISAPTNSIPIPADYIKLISMSYNGRELVMTDQSRVRIMSQYQGEPRIFARVGPTFYIAPMPAIGTTIEINYQADFSPLINPTDSNWLTNSGSRLVRLGALVEAYRFIVDPRIMAAEQEFQLEIQAQNDQAATDALTNASMMTGMDFGQHDTYHGHGWFY